jgi:hypothetical protein
LEEGGERYEALVPLDPLALGSEEVEGEVEHGVQCKEESWSDPVIMGALRDKVCRLI